MSATTHNGHVRIPHPRGQIRELIDKQNNPRDRCALGLTRLGLRKNDLRLLQIRDIDLEQDIVILRHGKRGKEAILPIAYNEVRQDLKEHVAAREPDEYLLYPKRDRTQPMNHSSIHRWFKRCLSRADLPDFPMHELRHSAADEIWRETGNIVLAQQLLRHKNIETTRRYLHPTLDDLRAGMRVVADAWAEDAS